MAASKSQTKHEPTSPIYLNQVITPSQLTYAETPCQSCLQSYLTTEDTKHQKMEYIKCPICKQSVGPISQNKPKSECASLIQTDIDVRSMLQTKVKFYRICDACNSEGVSVPAAGFCLVCEEAICNDCLNVHRKQKMTKSHNVTTDEVLLNTPQNVKKYIDPLTCLKHEQEDIQFYCKNHTDALCAICLFDCHRTCSNVKHLKDELPALQHETKLSEIIEELKKIESELETFTEINKSNLKNIECQVDGLTEQIREIRKKINTALDNLEERVKEEGNIIYKEVAIRKQKENDQCLSLIRDVRQSYSVCEIVHKYGTDIHKFLTAEKEKMQLYSYYTQVRETYKNIERMTVQVKFVPMVDAILSFSSSDIGKLLIRTDSTISTPVLREPIKCRLNERVETFTVNIPGVHEPNYTGVSFLPRNRVIIVDQRNSQCILLNKSHELLAKYELPTIPYDICMVDEDEVAVSLSWHKKLQILSIRDNVISPVRTIRTKFKCYGLVAAGEGDIIVVEDCRNNKYCWSRISNAREVKFSDHYHSPSGSLNHIALDRAKTRVYVTVAQTNYVHYFNMDGKKQYSYSSASLISPMGVAVDRNDNIFVVGRNSHNIHQLSQDGFLVQVITTAVPHYPRAISFDNSSDAFIITNDFQNNKLHIYQQKPQVIT